MEEMGDEDEDEVAFGLILILILRLPLPLPLLVKLFLHPIQIPKLSYVPLGQDG